MKKRKTVVIIVAILLGIFLLVENSKRREKELIREELQKPEVIAVIEETLNNLEKNLSNKDVIKSYEIDNESLYYNPMGGMEVTVYVNHDKDLEFQFGIIEDNEGVLKSSGYIYSGKLAKLLGE